MSWVAGVGPVEPHTEVADHVRLYDDGSGRAGRSRALDLLSVRERPERAAVSEGTATSGKPDPPLPPGAELAAAPSRYSPVSGFGVHRVMIGDDPGKPEER